MTTAAQIANTIRQQLGGSKFEAMTGARAHVALGRGLSFSLPRQYKGVNFVVILLLSDDTYAVTFARKMNYGLDIKQVHHMDGVQAEALRPLFAEVTGLATSL